MTTIYKEETEEKAYFPKRTLLLLFLIFFIISMLIWANYAELDEIKRSEGKIVPSLQDQIIQAPEAGVLIAIKVKEGDVVENNQPLMTLDPTQLLGQFTQTRHQASALKVKIERLKAESNELELNFSNDLISEVPDVIKGETSLFYERKLEQKSQLEILNRQLFQKRQELAEVSADIETNTKSLNLLRRELSIVEPLVQKKLEAETSLLSLLRSENDFIGKLNSAQISMKKIESAIAEIQEKIQLQVTSFRSKAFEELSQTISKLSEIEPTLPGLEQRVSRTEVRSPVKGIVNKIIMTTIGGVAQAGSQLLDIVPLDDTLIVEAYVKPTDIGFIYIGQQAHVKITAYDFNRYGGLDGQVISIGADAIKRQSSQNSEDFVYVVRIRTTGNLFDLNGQALQILPGMQTEVNLVVGKHSILEYLIKPVIKIKERAFKE